MIPCGTRAGSASAAALITSATNDGSRLVSASCSGSNPASPANREAAELFAEHKLEYQRRVLEVVEGSWSDADAKKAATKSKAATAASR